MCMHGDFKGAPPFFLVNARGGNALCKMLSSRCLSCLVLFTLLPTLPSRACVWRLVSASDRGGLHGGFLRECISVDIDLRPRHRAVPRSQARNRPVKVVGCACYISTIH